MRWSPDRVALGHEVIAPEMDVEDVGLVPARERPDVALVGKPPDDKESHISDTDVEAWQARSTSPCAVSLIPRVRDAFGRRATIERATGILMDRHFITEESACRCFASSRGSRTAN